MYNSGEDESKTLILKIDLTALAREGIPKMTKNWCAVLAECASLCLELNNHSGETQLTLQGDFNKNLPICSIEVDDNIRRTHKDLNVAAELGAYGIAFLLIERLTPFTVIERSKTTTGFDYWLGEKEDALMQRKARLEVSGLNNQQDREFKRRIKNKIDQTKVSDNLMIPAWIIVTHFVHPKTHIEVRKDTQNEPSTNR